MSPLAMKLTETAVVVMGVSGVGKTTFAKQLAGAMDCDFLEGDEFHSTANVTKMSCGIPLTDEDRWPWFDALAMAVGERRSSRGIVTACSALKRRYRDRLRLAIAEPIKFVCLVAQPATLTARMRGRSGHFMPDRLLDSQLATFEMPDADESVIVLSADMAVEHLMTELERRLG